MTQQATTWNAPEIEVSISDQTKTATVKQMEIVAARSQPVASLYMNLSNLHFEWNKDLKDYDPLIVRWGQRGNKLAPLFDGTVLRSHLQENLKVWGLCRGRSLADTHITRTYQDEEASAIIEHLVGTCGFTALDIASCPNILDKLPLHNSTIVEAIHYVNRRLSLDYAFWCDPTGGFHWGTRDYHHQAVASFTHGEDVIDFQSLPRNRFLLTVMGTTIWHSQIVSVFDRNGNETQYFVEQVRHTVGVNNTANNNEGVRSRLWLLEVSDE